jgi:hypothetical protein
VGLAKLSKKGGGREGGRETKEEKRTPSKLA